MARRDEGPGPLLGEVWTAEPARGMAWAGDDRVVVWGGPTVILAEAAGGATVASWTHGGTVEQAVVLGDGRIAACAYDNRVSIHDARGGATVARAVPVEGGRAVIALVPWGEHGWIAGDDLGCLYTWRGGAEEAAALDAMAQSDALWTGTALAVIGGALVRYGGTRLVIRPRVDGDAAEEAWLDGHTDAINGVLAMPGDRALTWSEDGTLRVWSVEARAALHVLAGHTAYVAGAAVTPDGGALSWALDGVRRWSARGELVRAFDAGVRPTGAVALPGGGVAMIAGDGVRVWAPGEPAPRVYPIPRAAGAVALPGERLVVWAQDDGALHVIDDRAAAPRRITGHAGAVLDVVAAPGGARVASLAGDGSVRIWRADFAGAEASPVARGSTGTAPAADEPRGAVRHAHLAGDGLVTAHALGALVLTDARTGAARWTVHEHGIEGVTAAGDAVATWSRERVQIRRAADGEVVSACAVEPGPTVLDPAAGLALTRSRMADPRPTTVWRIATGAIVATLESLDAHVQGAAWLAGGAVVLWLEGGEVAVWTPATGALAAVPLGGREADDVVALGAGFAAVTSGGRLFVTGAPDQAPRPIAEEIEGAAALASGALACWTTAGEYRFAAPSGALEVVAPARGHRPAWVAPAGDGLVAIEVDGAARYVARGATLAVADAPIQAGAVMATAAHLAVARPGAVELVRIPDGAPAGRWPAHGRVLLHGATRDGRFLASTAAGAIALIAPAT